jgi:hypothetical protein
MPTPSQAISQMTTLAGSNRNDNCFFTLYNALISSSANQNLKARISTHEQFYSNNNTVINQGTYNNYFGTGKEGSLTISSSAQVSASLNNINNAFGDPVVKNFQSLTVNGGVLFTPLRACRGMIIYCTGNLTVNGTISMTGKGGGVATKIAAPIGIATSTDSRYDLVDATLYFNNFSSSVAGGRGIPTHWNWAPSGSAWFSNYKIRVPLSGSVAGASGISATGPAGIFCCGGGGAGGSGGGAAAGSGGRGTIFSGGAGGGAGGNPVIGNQGGAGSFDAGGNGVSAVPAPFNGIGGGGAGSPAGLGGPGGTPTSNGTPGAGGLLILIVRGNITINGTISNNGRVGGNGSITPGQPAAGGGGGSGGGRTIIIYGGTYTNAGSVVVNGGSGGAAAGPGGTAGGAGGAGAITVRRVNV